MIYSGLFVLLSLIINKALNIELKFGDLSPPNSQKLFCDAV